MPKEVILRQLVKDMENEEAGLRLVMNSAAVLKKVRASCVFSVSVANRKSVFAQMEKAGVSYRILFQDEKKCIVFFFQSKMLEAHLKKAEVLQYLEKFNYQRGTFTEYLSRFADRMKHYYTCGGEFPHEMGVFLQYPLDDVESFIKNGGKNFLISGYWKVYNNIEQARGIFQLLDEAKNRAIDEWFGGKQIYEIAG